jgi:hypothetical protein
MKYIAVLTLLMGVVGCRNGQPPVPPSSPPPPSMSSAKAEPEPMMMMQRGQSSIASSAAAPVGMRVDLYQLQLPQGAISQNEKFWKRVDEHCVDPNTYDLLYKNGIRVGQAPIAEWDYFKQVMEQYPAIAKQSSLVAGEGKAVELSVRKGMPSQDIWYYNADNVLEGKTFDACENVVALTFQPAPRHASAMRVVLCPTVRSTQKRLQYSATNSEVEVTYAAPQRMYDLNLRTDVSMENFLIVAPSSDASRKTSIGNGFFMTAGTAERLENVLLIIPRSMRVEEVSTPAPRR